MNPHDAVAFIAAAVPSTVATWADLGAGGGTFTSALAELLQPGSRVYAVDRDPDAVASLRRLKVKPCIDVVATVADFAAANAIPGIGGGTLDGMLLANTLHFVRDAGVVLARLAVLVKPGGRVVIVEYDRRAASRWVPYPIPSAGLSALAAAAALSEFAVVATRPSRFSGILYAAVATVR